MNTPPVLGTRATSPRSVLNVERSSWANCDDIRISISIGIGIGIGEVVYYVRGHGYGCSLGHVDTCSGA